MQGEIRISKKDFESEQARRYGSIDRWYHLECFEKVRENLEFYENGDVLPGIKDLSKEDQAKVKTALPKIKSDNIPTKKVKKETEDAEEEEEMKTQNSEIFKIKDMLSIIKKSDLAAILEKNEQQIPEGVSAVCTISNTAYDFKETIFLII